MSETPIPNAQAWSPEHRRSDTLRFIEWMRELDALHLIRPGHLANSYRGMTEHEIEAEMMKRLPEGEGK